MTSDVGRYCDHRFAGSDGIDDEERHAGNGEVSFVDVPAHDGAVERRPDRGVPVSGRDLIHRGLGHGELGLCLGESQAGLVALNAALPEIRLANGIDDIVGVVSQRAGRRRREHKRYDV